MRARQPRAITRDQLASNVERIYPESMPRPGLRMSRLRVHSDFPGDRDTVDIGRAVLSGGWRITARKYEGYGASEVETTFDLPVTKRDLRDLVVALTRLLDDSEPA